MKSAEKVFPKLIENYNIVKDYINDDNLKSKEPLRVSLFEDFNTHILSSITFPDYYNLFNKKALIIFDIYHMTNVIENDLPYEIASRFEVLTKNYIDKQEQDKNKERSMSIYKMEIDVLTKLIDLKIGEINILKNKIVEFLKVH